MKHICKQIDDIDGFDESDRTALRGLHDLRLSILWCAELISALAMLQSTHLLGFDPFWTHLAQWSQSQGTRLSTPNCGNGPPVGVTY